MFGAYRLAKHGARGVPPAGLSMLTPICEPAGGMTAPTAASDKRVTYHRADRGKGSFDQPANYRTVGWSMVFVIAGFVTLVVLKQLLYLH
jgi:hypothetical protein